MAKRRDRLLSGLGLRIRQLRESKAWTQEALAEAAELDRSYIAGIEAGLRNPSFRALAKLAQGFDLSIAKMLEDVREF